MASPSNDEMKAALRNLFVPSSFARPQDQASLEHLNLPKLPDGKLGSITDHKILELKAAALVEALNDLESTRNLLGGHVVSNNMLEKSMNAISTFNTSMTERGPKESTEDYLTRIAPYVGHLALLSAPFETAKLAGLDIKAPSLTGYAAKLEGSEALKDGLTAMRWVVMNNVLDATAKEPSLIDLEKNLADKTNGANTYAAEQQRWMELYRQTLIEKAIEGLSAENISQRPKRGR